MAITFSIDNDRTTAGIQNLTLDQTAGTQTPTDGNDVNLAVVSGQLDGFGPTANVLDTGFETYLSGLGLDTDDKNFAALVDGASSSSTFIQATANAGETFTDLRFVDPGSTNLVTGLQTLAGEALYLHVDASGNYATLTTATGSGGRIVAAFALTNEVINNTTHVSTAGVQMVTFEAIKHNNTGSIDETLPITDILQIGALATRSFDFDALQSGASLWCAVGNSSGAVLITGGDPQVDSDNKMTNTSDTIHTSQGGDGTTIGVDNQLFDNAGETAVITLVTGFNNLVGADAGATGVYTVDPKPNDNKPEGIDYSGYINVSGAAVYLSQSQGNDPKDLDIVLWEAGGDAGGTQTAEDLTNYIPGLASDTPVNVASVTIKDDDGNVVGVWGAGGTLTSGQSVNGWTSTNGVANVTVTFSGNTIQVDGVLGEYTVGWTSASGETFNRFEVIGQSGQFDIGQVDITESLSSATGLGSHLFVDDDGPFVDLILDGTAELRLDETDNDSDDNNVGGILATNTLAAAAYLTTNTATFGTDGQASSNPNVWSLTLAGANVNGVDSGLDDAVTNSNVMLFVVNGTTIEGRVGNAAGAVVMSISINSTTGALTVTQNRAVEHNDPNDNDEAGTSSAMMNSGLISAVHAITDGDGDSASDSVDISQVVKLEDDGPGITGQPGGSATPNDLQVGNVVGSQDSSSYTLAPGSDGQASFIIQGPADSTGDFTWSYFNVDGTNGTELNEIKGFYKGTALYTLELDDNGGYVFKMIGTLPGAQFDFSAAEIKAGAPNTNSIDVGAVGGTEYVTIAGGGGAINESHGFVGVGNGNLDPGESLTLSLHEADGDLIPFTSINIGTKSAQASSYSWVATKVGGGTISGTENVGKNQPIDLSSTDLQGFLIESVTITKISGPAIKIGVDDIHIFTLPDDVQLGFTVKLTDGDGDSTTSSFVVDIDGNNDGTYDSNVNALSALPTLKHAGFTSDSGMAPSSHSGILVGADDTSSALKIEALNYLHTPDYYMV